MSSFAVNSIAGDIFNKFRWRLQHSPAQVGKLPVAQRQFPAMKT
jgi:hypothetical protein